MTSSTFVRAQSDQRFYALVLKQILQYITRKMVTPTDSCTLEETKPVTKL